MIYQLRTLIPLNLPKDCTSLLTDGRSISSPSFIHQLIGIRASRTSYVKWFFGRLERTYLDRINRRISGSLNIESSLGAL